MAKWTLMIEATMGWKGEEMNLQQLERITTQVNTYFLKNKVPKQFPMPVEYEIYNEKEGSIRIHFDSFYERNKILEPLSEVTFKGHYTVKLIEHYSTGSMYSQVSQEAKATTTTTFSPKYTKEVIEEAIEKLRYKEARIESHIRSLDHYIGLCSKGIPCPDYERKAEMIMEDIKED